MRVVLAGLLALSLGAVSVGAEHPKFLRGQKVQVKFGAETYKGEVVRVMPNGWVMVKYADWAGNVRTQPYPPDLIQRVAKTSKAAKTGQASAGDRSSRKSSIRTWTDKSGKFTIRARFLEISDGNVRLEQADGKTVAIPLEQLSDADRKEAQDAAKTPGGSPFKAEENSGPAEDQSEDKSEVLPADWSDVKSLMLEPVGPWTLKADPAAPLTLEPKAIAFTGTKKVDRRHESELIKADAIFLNRKRSEALVFASDRFQQAWSTDVPPVVHRVDLAKGKTFAPIVIKGSGKILDVDPAGRRVAMTSQQSAPSARSFPAVRTPYQVQVWELDNKAAKLVSAWDPAGDDEQHVLSDQPTFARFIDADHLLTVNFWSKLVLWEVSTRRALYTLHLNGHSAFTLSPNGKYLAAAVKEGIGILDPLTGQTLGLLKCDFLYQPLLSFQPDGKRLAASLQGHVRVWDFEKAELYRDVFFPESGLAASIDWVADGYVLVGGSKLVDLERRIVLWEYQVPFFGNQIERNCGELGGVLWYTAGNFQAEGVIGVKLPHPDALAKAASLKAEDLLVLKPGSRVKLTVKISESVVARKDDADQSGEQRKQDKIKGDDEDPAASDATKAPPKKTAEQIAAERKKAAEQRAADEKKITATLTAQLLRLGMVIDPSSPLVLAATIETGKTEEKNYREFGHFNDDPKKVNVTEHIARLRLLEGSDVYWESSLRSAVGRFVHHQVDQSPQDAVDQLASQCVFFFSIVELPQYLARPGHGGAYGASVLSDAGITNVPIEQLHPAAQPQKPDPPKAAPLRRSPARPGAANRPGASGNNGL
jgi:hypothetical protein